MTGDKILPALQQPDARRSFVGLLAWLVGAVNITLAICYIGLWPLVLGAGILWRADFTAFYTAGVMLQSGVRAELYDFALQERYQRELLEGHSFAGGLLSFINPPHAALLFAPLVPLGLFNAYWVWLFVQLVLLGVVLRAVWALSDSWPRQSRLLLCTAVLAFPPLVHTMLKGTLSLLILTCLLMAYRATLAGRWGRGGLWLALVSVKPQMVLFPLLAASANRMWRLVLAFALFSGALVLGTLPLFGLDGWLRFAQTLRAADSFYGVYGVWPMVMYNLKGALTQLLGYEHGPLISQLSGLALVASAVVTLLLWRKPQQPGTPQFDLRLALSVVLGLLFSPHLYAHDALLLVLPALLLARYLHSQGRLGQAGLFLFWPALFASLELAFDPTLYSRIATLFIVALVLWLGWELRRSAQTES